MRRKRAYWIRKYDGTLLKRWNGVADFFHKKSEAIRAAQDIGDVGFVQWETLRFFPLDKSKAESVIHTEV